MKTEKSQNALAEMFKGFFCPIHPEGYLFIAIFAVVALILWLLSHFLGVVGLIATLWCAYFFRNPARVTPQREGLIISPADGRVSDIVKMKPPAELEMGDAICTRVSIFLNVLDVHINRVPASGSITMLHYYHGKFLNASLDKASEHNERQLVKMKLEDGRDLAFVQIAGLIARRILCQLTTGQQVRAGEIFGLIRFGSRMDIYLPAGVEAQVLIGQRAIGGETIIADYKSAEPARTGVTQ